MNDVVKPKWSSLRPRLIEAMMFLRVNMSMNPNNPTDVIESPIWNTLILSHPKLPDDIDDSDNNENEEEDDDDNDIDDLSPMPIESGEANYTCWF